MNAHPANDHDERGEPGCPPESDTYDELLAQIDEALATGSRSDYQPSDIDDELRERLLSGSRVLEQLHRLWPRRSGGVHDTPRVQADKTLRVEDGLPSVDGIELGRFIVRRELGRGGNGIVFLADDPQLERLVALKVPHLEIVTSGPLRRRFFQESRAAAGLDHPHIVPIYEAGEIGPICYIASAFCEGLTLAEWLSRQTSPTPAAEVARLMLQLSDAMAHAHARGVLHRDLKPSNILLVPRAGTKRKPAGNETDSTSTDNAADEAELPLSHFDARIADFGLAKVVETNEFSTRDGAVLGTPSYMAPEQAAGRVDSLTSAVDIYGLGAVIYELLVGRPPFQGETTVEILMQVRTEEPVEVARLRPGLPRDITTICHKCLQKDPRRRYASAEEVRDECQRFLDGRPIQAHAVGRVERWWRMCRRRPWEAILASALIVAVIAGFLGVYSQWRRAESRAAEAFKQRQLAMREKARAEETLRVAIQSVDNYFTKLSEDSLVDRPGSELLREQILESARRYYEEFLKTHQDSPQLRRELAAAWYRIGLIRGRLGRDAQAAEAYREAQQRIQGYLESHPDDPAAQLLLTQCRIGIADDALNRGDLYEAEQLLRRTLALAAGRAKQEELAGRDDWIKAAGSAHALLSLVLSARGADQEAIANGQAAVALYEPLVRRRPDDLVMRYTYATAVSKLGYCYESLGQVDRAVEAWSRCVECFPDIPESSTFRAMLANTHTNLGIVAARRGRVEEARQHYDRAKQLIERAMDANPDAEYLLHTLAPLYLNYGSFLRKMGDQTNAGRYLVRAERLWSGLVEREPQVTSYWHGLAKSKLALAYLARNNRDTPKARQLLQEAYEIWARISREHEDVVAYRFQCAAVRSVLASSYSQAGDTEKALELYPQVIDTYRAILQQHPGLIEVQSALGAVLNDVAITYRKEERYNEAIDLCLEAIRAQKAAYDTAPEIRVFGVFLRNHYDTLGSVYRAAGRPREALDAYRQLRPFEEGDALRLVRLSRHYLQVAQMVRADGPDAGWRRDCVELSLKTLEEAVDAGFAALQFLQTDPVFQTLKSDVRFQRLIDRVAKVKGT